MTEKNVTSYDVSRSLNDLGFKRDSCFVYNFSDLIGWYFSKERYKNSINSYLAEELLEAIKPHLDYIDINMQGKYRVCLETYTKTEKPNFACRVGSKLSDVLGECIIFLIENNEMEIK